LNHTSNPVCGSLPFKPLYQPFFVFVFWDRVSRTICPGLALNRNPPDLCLLSSIITSTGLHTFDAETATISQLQVFRNLVLAQENKTAVKIQQDPPRKLFSYLLIKSK
jgi:hypothetical protein